MIFSISLAQILDKRIRRLWLDSPWKRLNQNRSAHCDNCIFGDKINFEICSLRILICLEIELIDFDFVNCFWSSLILCHHVQFLAIIQWLKQCFGPFNCSDIHHRKHPLIPSIGAWEELLTCKPNGGDSRRTFPCRMGDSLPSLVVTSSPAGAVTHTYPPKLEFAVAAGRYNRWPHQHFLLPPLPGYVVAIAKRIFLVPSCMETPHDTSLHWPQPSKDVDVVGRMTKHHHQQSIVGKFDVVRLVVSTNIVASPPKRFPRGDLQRRLLAH